MVQSDGLPGGGMKHNPNYMSIKATLGVLTDSPQTFKQVRELSGLSDLTVHACLICLRQLGLVQKVELPRSAWVGGSRPRFGYVKVIE
jgi:hypothetical protein